MKERGIFGLKIRFSQLIYNQAEGIKEEEDEEEVTVHKISSLEVQDRLLI